MGIRIMNVRGIRDADERAKICYVGRRAGGWPSTPWGNPFKPGRDGTIEECLAAYRSRCQSQPEDWWSDLWKVCQQGAKPLGCWCVDAEQGDGKPIICHAQILAAELHQRFENQTA